VPKDRLVLAGLKAEAAVSGYHADNIAPALLGGFTIVRCQFAVVPRVGVRVTAVSGYQRGQHRAGASGRLHHRQVPTT